jgi:hypothetical protein
MIRLAILLCLILAMPCGAATTSPYSEFNSSETMLIIGRLEALARSDDPLVVAEGNRVVISNGCGYDTAIVRIEEQLGPDYELSEVAAHLELGEFCTSFLQQQVKDYLLALRWNGTVWEIDAALSSRLLPDSKGELWLVEPELVALIEANGPKAKSVDFSATLLEDLAIGIEERRGVRPDPGVSRQQQLDDLRSLKPVRGEWPDNPLYFRKGISLKDLLAWLAANNSFKPKPLRGSA